MSFIDFDKLTIIFPSGGQTSFQFPLMVQTNESKQMQKCWL